eukprot:CAMPEP_0113424144 /NCGR_PEP_ID=MMETSP0013_2-20120614/29426_1 /TAXON_ID=2843 ORGANISM="Skeletonema costatum, Strain 1716" /NCGR_SAMPLE_ID=MMETSP0013_2 /ASSEMBLY_ACC=CAM_ASM_000158 /LENGTH=740 /DNA_ID=CAMNT_0000312113 /DNA_START=110 /DNA_END=2332 /DNA_ORIENTATION=+ /assembly_acc=CAM_ASM_000158
MTSVTMDSVSQEVVTPAATNAVIDDEERREINNIKEMKEVTKEFQRSLSISNDDGLNSSQKENEQSENSNEQSNTADGKRHFLAPKDFELLKVIGMGAFGKVLQVRNRHSTTVYAMKIISKRLIKRKMSYVENILAERNILSKISNHPFIVTMHASFQTREKLFIIMDFCAGGELFLKLGKEGHFRERTAAFYLAEIILALEHLHSVNVLHRDLKPENILLGTDGHLCLTDFGLAKDFTGNGDSEDDWARTLCGTMEYMAPEMVARKWYGKGADYWSLGCIAYEMMSGQPPFESKKGSKDLFRKIMSERVRMPDCVSACACKLLKGLLNRDVNKRLGSSKGTFLEVGGVGALKQQTFFAGLDWGKLERREIDPPEDFSVDNDEDLRHFHDEFVNMTLPRSVKEMSKLDFLPRHCESENFRGFSFIGESFPIIERNKSEEEHYWNNVDDDGQSLSECASSVFDDDMNEVSPPEPEPAKKKRPPRKKKKKQQTIPLETTKEGNEKSETASQTGTELSIEKPGVVDASLVNKPSSPDTSDAHKSVAITRKEVIQPLDSNKSTTASEPKPPQARLDATASPKLANNSTALKSLNPAAKSWQVVPKTPSPSLLPVAPSVQSSSTTPVYTPKPGTWASLAVKSKPNQTHKTVIVSQQAARAPATAMNRNIEHPASPKKPPTDWRSHVVSPRQQKMSANMNTKLVPPPPLAPGQSAWPSLGDFPPPPGANAAPKQQTKPVGAWGKAV